MLRPVQCAKTPMIARRCIFSAATRASQPRTTGAAAPVVRGCEARVAAEKMQRRAIIGVLAHWTGRSIVGEPSLKACLEEAHASLMTRLNQRFWKGEMPPEAPAKAAPRM